MNKERAVLESTENNAEKVRSTNLLVASITVFAFAIRQIRAQDPIGGFHAFNEAWYSILASNYTSLDSLLFPLSVYGSIDYNVSPLFSYMLLVSGSLLGFSEVALRLVPILFSALTVPILYSLGKRFFGVRTGIIAAAFYAFAPVSVIVGRNIQTDSMYVFLMLLSLLLYIRAGDAPARRLSIMAMAGLFFGLAFMTKQFAAILLPTIFAWELIRNRGIRWFGWGHLIFGFAALIFPGPFFLYHLIHNYDIMFSAQSALSASQYVTLSAEVTEYITSEYIWGLSPPIAILAVIGIICFFIKRSEGGWLIIVTTVVFNSFFMHWHGHSYYILFLTPFLCLAAAAPIGSLKWRVPAAAASAAISIFAAILSIAILCVIKFGYCEFSEFVKVMNKQSLKPVVILTKALGGSYYPVFRFYGRNLDILREKDLALLESENLRFSEDRSVFIAGYGTSDSSRLPPYRFPIYRIAYGLIFFGYQFAVDMESEHFFKVNKILFFKNGRRSDIGLVKIGAYKSLIVGFIEPGSRIPMRDGWIDFSPGANQEENIKQQD